MGGLHENIQLMLEFLKVSFFDLHFPYYTLHQASDLRKQLELASELVSDLRDTVDWGRKWFVDFSDGKLNWFCFTSLITLVLLM